MSGFLIRRFILQNISAVAMHCPVPAISRAALAVTTGTSLSRAGTPSSPSSSTSSSFTTTTTSSSPSGLSDFLYRCLIRASSGQSQGTGFSLVTEEEMKWIWQQREFEAEESRIVLSTRPTRSVVRGLAGSALNVVLGCFLSVIVFLSATLEKMRLSTGPVGFVLAPFYGAAWGGVFLSVSCYAAVQQTALSVYLGWLATPAHYCFHRRADDASCVGATAKQWGVLSCKFEAPMGIGQPHPLLSLYPSDTVLRERAMKRLAQGKRGDKTKAKYSGKKRGTSAAEDDYYDLLGVQTDATEKEIKDAFNRLVLKLHPDKNPSPQAASQFDAVTKAYRVLSSPAKRKKYDLGGAKGVDDLGEKKREGVRGVFGGETLNKLSGDVFIGSFSQRVIDGLDFVADELAVMKQRMYERCRDELLTEYLSQYRPLVACDGKASGSSKTTSREDSRTPAGQEPWSGAFTVKLRKLLATGLAREVVYVQGKEYERAVKCYDFERVMAASRIDGQGATHAAESKGLSLLSVSATAALRMKEYMSEVAPHRLAQRKMKIKYLTTIRSDTFKNSEAMVDLAWYSSVEEFELTARWVAFSVLYDPTINAEEAQRRRDALSALADVFIRHGQVYRGANKSTMDQLMSSLREYQQQQQREKDNK